MEADIQPNWMEDSEMITCEECDFATFKPYGVYCEAVGEKITDQQTFLLQCPKISEDEREEILERGGLKNG